MVNNKFFDLTLYLPSNEQIWFQQPASPVMEGIVDLQLEMSFHFIYLLTLVIYGLLGSIIWFNESKTAYSSRVSHWTSLERVYSIIPMVSIICIYAPSFSLLYAMDEYPDTNVCVKIVGRQWYWHYEVTYDGYTYYKNIDKFISNEILSDTMHTYKNLYKQIMIFNTTYQNFEAYLENFFNQKVYFSLDQIGPTNWSQDIIDCLQKGKNLHYLHTILWDNLIANAQHLANLNNYAFDSYCLSDYSLKTKYIKPQIVFNNLKHLITHNGRSLTRVPLDTITPIKQYLTIDSNLVINNFHNFQTFRTSRLLEVSKALILPTGTVIRGLVTSSDVIHSWAIPSLGIKTDGIPGRLNQVFFSISKSGIYYGQCSELCGQYHFAMPIVIKALSQ